MKIGIVTIFDMVNYGNRLQNYAVCEYLKKKGVTAETLVCEPPTNTMDKIKWCIWKWIYLWRIPIKKTFDPGIERWYRFEKFTSQYIPTRIIYDAKKHMPKAIDYEYDAFLCGSDQIWNPQFPGRFGDYSIHYKDYFLTFASDEKKYSISASFGVSSIPKEWDSRIQEQLKRFRKISVREEEGAEIIYSLTGRNVEILSDPVMLLTKEEWMNISRAPKKNFSIDKPYILEYFLSPKTKEQIYEIEEKINTAGYQIYRLWDITDQRLFVCDPCEFIYLIQHAELVCTDSFHACAFSIMFHRLFVTFDRGNMNGRIQNLLHKYEISNRNWMSLNNADVFSMDYSNVDLILEQERSKLDKYLDSVIQDIAQES